MGCLTKITADILPDCGAFLLDSQLAGFDEIILINRSDIASFSFGATSGAYSNINMSAGARAYTVGVIKNSSNAAIGIRQLDNAPAMQEHTVNLTAICGSNPSRSTLIAIPNGDFVAVFKPRGADPTVLGLLSGLTCSDISGSSNGNGFITYTLKTPENCAGDRLGFIAAAAYEALKKPKA